MRAVLSILIFVHVFIVFVCLCGNLIPSLLQQRLLGLFQPYTQLLNFELDGTRFFLTHATIRDVDHRIEVLPKGAAGNTDSDWLLLSRGMHGSERYGRYQRLADTLAFFEEDEAVTALIAEGVARYYLMQADTPVNQLRCRQHILQSWAAARSPSPAQRDPDSPGYFSELYRANVITLGDRQIRIVKRAAAALEAAPDRKADGSRGTGGAAGQSGRTGAGPRNNR